jgi:hypothetical protein
MPNRHPRRVALVLPLAALALAACGGAPDTKDFADKAASFIEGQMAEASTLNGLTFTDAVCDEPASTKSGTEYSCTAMGSDGQQRTLTVKIVNRNSLQVTKLVPPPPDAGTATTATRATTATTAPGAPVTTG